MLPRYKDVTPNGVPESLRLRWFQARAWPMVRATSWNEKVAHHCRGDHCFDTAGHLVPLAAWQADVLRGWSGASVWKSAAATGEHLGHRNFARAGRFVVGLGRRSIQAPRTLPQAGRFPDAAA